MTLRTKARDRRRFTRYFADLELQITRLNTGMSGLRQGNFGARALDISQSGARFVCQELFYPHEKLELAFFGTDGQAKVRCEAVVIRSKRIPRQYETATRFVKALPIEEQFGDEEQQ